MKTKTETIRYARWEMLKAVFMSFLSRDPDEQVGRLWAGAHLSCYYLENYR